MRRFNSSSKAWWYGSGDMYIVAMSVLPMRYWVTRLVVVCLLVGVLSWVGSRGRVVVVLAAVVVMSGAGVACSGSEYVRGWWPVDQITLGFVGGVIEGQGAAVIVD